MFTAFRPIAALLLLAGLGSGADSSAWRQWTAASGQYTVSAKFLGMKGQTVELLRDDGQKINVSLSRLSAADQEYVQGLDSVEVVVDGVGATSQEARDDALCNAVQAVVGTLTDTQTLVENDRLIRASVLTHSGGFVSRDEKLKEERVGGQVRVTIRATVRRRQLRERLTTAVNEPASDLYGEARTRFTMLRSGLMMMQKELENYPANVLRCDFSHALKTVTADGSAKVVDEVVVTIDEKKYNRLCRRLIDILEPMARLQSPGRATYRLLYDDGGGPRIDRLADRFRLAFFKAGKGRSNMLAEFEPIEYLIDTQAQGFEGARPGGYKPEESPTRVILHMQSGEPGTGGKWRFFEIDGTLTLPNSALAIDICYRDNQGQLVHSTRAVLGPTLPGLSLDSRQWSTGRLSTLVISPFFLWHEQFKPAELTVFFSRSLTLRGEATFTVDQMSRMKPPTVLAVPLPLSALDMAADQTARPFGRPRGPIKPEREAPPAGPSTWRPPSGLRIPY